MGQRVRIKKNGASKGVAIRKTSFNSPKNTVTVRKTTGKSNRKNSSKNTIGKKKIKIKRRRK